MSKYPNFNTPYEAGYDAAENGSSVRNCHFGFFSTPERTKEWECGNKDGKADVAATAEGRPEGTPHQCKSFERAKGLDRCVECNKLWDADSGKPIIDTEEAKVTPTSPTE